MAIRKTAKAAPAKKTPARAGRAAGKAAPAVKQGPKARAAALAAKKAEALAARKAKALAAKKKQAAQAKKAAPAPARGRGKAVAAAPARAAKGAKKATQQAVGTTVFIKMVVTTQAAGKPTEGSYFGAQGQIIPRSTVKAVVGDVIYHEVLVPMGTRRRRAGAGTPPRCWPA